jgi:hypothetical protein
MKHIRELSTNGLVWMQPQAMVCAFELRGGEELFATLRWESSLSSFADAVASDGHWTFNRTGLFDPRIGVRVHGQDGILALFIPTWTADGVLEFAPDGRAFWKGSGAWRSRWSFSDASGEQLVDFEECGSMLSQRTSVKLTPTGLARTDLSLLVLLGFYLILLQSDDEAAANVACAVT